MISSLSMARKGLLFLLILALAMPIGHARKTPLQEAYQYINLTEQKDYKRLQKLLSIVTNIDPRKTPWCAAFVGAILERSGHKSTGSLLARSYLKWGERTKNPKKGDIVVLKRGTQSWQGHVGFFLGYKTIKGIKYVKVLGGNQKDKVGVNYYPASKILDVRTY